MGKLREIAPGWLECTRHREQFDVDWICTACLEEEEIDIVEIPEVIAKRRGDSLWAFVQVFLADGGYGGPDDPPSLPWEEFDEKYSLQGEKWRHASLLVMLTKAVRDCGLISEVSHA